MKLLEKFPGRHYFISVFIIGTALFLTFSMVIYHQYDTAQKLNEWTLHNYEVNRQSRLLVLDLLNMETGVRGYLLSGKRRFLGPYESALATLPLQIRHLRELMQDDPNANAQIDGWLKDIETYQDMLSAQLHTYQLYGRGAITPAMLEAQKAGMDNLRAHLEASVNKRLDRLHDQVETSKQENRNFLYILIIGTVMAITSMLLASAVIIGLITRSQKAAKDIAIAEERFVAVMNGINDGVYDYNPQTKTVYYSPALKHMLGYTDAEFSNSVQAFTAIIHPEDVEKAWEQFRRYESHEIGSYSNTMRLRHKDGGWRWIMSRGIGFWDKDDKMTRLIGTHTDITEQKKREERLSQLNDEMETFTYIASHDLRSPLVNLRGFTRELRQAIDSITPLMERMMPQLLEAEQVVMKRALEEDIPEALKFIESATQRMDTLTTAVLDLSRIGRREYSNEVVDVQAIVQKCLNALNYEISHSRTQVTCEELPVMMSDPLALEQVFSNLLDNAVKYLDPARPGEIAISVRQTPSDIIFAVQDNGRGIAEYDRQKVFEIFRRARNTGDVRGLGMGMAFVKATLQKLGGAIWCDSHLGTGTTFYIRLPKTDMQEIAA